MKTALGDHYDEVWHGVLLRIMEQEETSAAIELVERLQSEHQQIVPSPAAHGSKGSYGLKNYVLCTN